MRPAFDMDALRTMVAGVELGSFARAAAKLGRSQSAVSMQLRKLEQQAGQPLLRRNGRGLVPTEAGDALLAYARRIVALNDEAAASLDATAATATVRIGLPQDFIEDVLPVVMTRFSRQQPGVQVEVRAGRNYNLAEDVQAGRLDVAIAFALPGSDARGTRVRLPAIAVARREGIRQGFARRCNPAGVVRSSLPVPAICAAGSGRKRDSVAAVVDDTESTRRLGGAALRSRHFSQDPAPGSGRNHQRRARSRSSEIVCNRTADDRRQPAFSGRVKLAGYPRQGRPRASDCAKFRIAPVTLTQAVLDSGAV